MSRGGGKARVGAGSVLARDHQLFGEPKGYARHDVAAGHQQHRLLKTHLLAEVCHACAPLLPSPPRSPQAGNMHVAQDPRSPSERRETPDAAVPPCEQRGPGGRGVTERSAASQEVADAQVDGGSGAPQAGGTHVPHLETHRRHPALTVFPAQPCRQPRYDLRRPITAIKVASDRINSDKARCDTRPTGSMVCGAVAGGAAGAADHDSRGRSPAL